MFFFLICIYILFVYDLTNDLFLSCLTLFCMYIYNNVQSNRMSEKVNKKTEQLMLQPNMWMESWKVNNQSVRFFNMNWEEKIASQFCDGIKEDVKRLPNFCKTEENQDWLDLKMAASKEAILKTVQWMENAKCSDDEDENFDDMHNPEDDDDPMMQYKKD